MLESDHPAMNEIRRDLKSFQVRLNRLTRGTLGFGPCLDGFTWTDSTKEDKNFCRIKIAELEKLTMAE